MGTTTGSTSFPAFVGDVYARWTLDCLVEIGYAISLDFVNKPYLYKGQDIPDVIVELRMSYGSSPHFANTVQRQAMMLPIFGRSDGLKPDATTSTWPFQIARRKLIDACTAFSERAVDSGVPMLEQSVRSALIPLLNHLQTLDGKSFQLSGNELQQETDSVIEILRSTGVDTVFSIGSKIDETWPLDSTDPDGALLVENVGLALSLSGDYKLSRTKFAALQEAAQEGAKALFLVLTTNPNDENQLLTLISQCYTWGKSLRDFQQT